MNFPKYEKYINSQEAWIGQVPDTWHKNKFKYIFSEKPSTQNMNLPFGAISFGQVVFKQDKANLTDELKSNYQEVLTGEFLINPLNLNYDLKSLRTALSEIDVVVSSGYIVLNIKPKLTYSKKFMEYLLYVFDINHMKSLGAGIRQTITFKDIGNSLIYLPPITDQKNIASFLNKETSHIDTLISKQEQLIKLLEEQRKSIISHAVTKGLNPNAAMKDSGIEWLGEIPAHWDVKPIKSLYSRVKKTGFENETLLSVYREYGVIVKSSRDDNHNKESDDLSPYQLVNVGDLVINKMKAWQGSLAISEHRGIVSPAYYIYEPFESDELNNKFIHNQIRSQYFIQSYKNYSKGIRVGQWDLESDLFVRINLYIPPTDEQNEIVDYIQSETNKINNLIDKQKLLIEKLQEYRSSIISHAVTGKIDVREAL